MEEQTVICLHSETINSATHIGICHICGQQRWYDPEDTRHVKLIKRGRIKGVLTMVVPPSVNQPVASNETKAEKEPELVPEPGTVEEEPAPRRSKKTKKRPLEYWDQFKDAMVADHKSMRLRDFFAKWHISGTQWMKLKTRWGVTPKKRTIPHVQSDAGRARRQYFEQHKDEMIADYYSMRLVDFFAKWKVSSKRWKELKKEWGVTPKLERIVVPLPTERIKEPPTYEEAIKLLAEANLDLAWYRGYRQHVLDTEGK